MSSWEPPALDPRDPGDWLRDLAETIGWGIINASRGVFLGRMAQLEAVLGQLVGHLLGLDEPGRESFRRAVLSELSLHAKLEALKGLSPTEQATNDPIATLGRAIQLRNILAHALPPEIDASGNHLVFSRWHKGELREDSVRFEDLTGIADQAEEALADLWRLLLGPDAPPVPTG